ncbi:hypothetical protein HJC23_005164 [Cyclotella cryptica]|uniref:Uncharacterized protein n=1 Tax=Cyclotella cryptica TaxID=29204 RepID=A0ABD3QF36_9STRA|eukprot:CCRYP_005869-RA/>CCRYP_005869-RA protein AED:0.21 eAED:0.21 QI:0/-1/0/1/-1/1/1/0/410
MDAGSETPHPHSLLSSNESAAEDEDDDPANDEETTCSICLINRQGPCRRYWLKFERCMKDHSAEKERRELERKRKEEEEEEEKVEEEMNVKEERASENGNNEMSMEEEWDRFMEKSVMPGEEEEEDEDEEEEEDEDDEDENEEDDENSNNEENHNSSDDDDEQINTEPSLGERCDKFMIPWISCIQEHRNVYSLISNAFYQKDYVDPLEESVPDHKRRPFTKMDAAIGEKEGYVVKFMGAEVDLGNWREHVEAQAEEDFSVDEEEEEEKASQRETTHKKMVDPHLINAYAKFKLTEPKTGNPIEVAYIKDQKGRLLGFDSFSKRESAPENDEDEEQMHSGREKVHDGSTMEHGKIHDGECTFHIEPGETTSVAAYAIYRSKKVDDKGEEQREYLLYYTPHIPLPGNQSGK